MKQPIYILLFLISFNGEAQVDSLKESLLRTTDNKEKQHLLLTIANDYCSKDKDSTVKYANAYLKLSTDHDLKIDSTAILGYLGKASLMVSEYDLAIDYFSKALKKLGDVASPIKAYHLIGMGGAYFGTGKFDISEDYYSQALEVYKEIADSAGIARAYNNLGNVHMIQGEYEEGTAFWNKSLEMKLAMNNMRDAASTMGNLAIYYGDIGETGLATKYYKDALKIHIKYKDYDGTAIVARSMGSMYAKQGAVEPAKRYFDMALEYAHKINGRAIIGETHFRYSKLYEQLGQYQKALEHYKTYVTTRDSIFNEESKARMDELQTKYQSEKKDLEIKALEGKQAAKDAQLHAQNEEIRRKATQGIAFAVGGGLALILAVVALLAFINKRKDNRLIAAQKEEVEKQKQVADNQRIIVEEKNKEILDSINYAKRIQSAILPPNKVVKEYLPDSFVLYKPKDIVAGDFYWMEPTEKGILFAAADCTGHGVPGALVSVVCNNGLNRSVREYGLSEPGKILDRTRELVVQEFEKSEEGVSDGMDIALCMLQEKKLHYAGAHNPLWIIRKGADEIEEVKADKQPIGQFAKPRPHTTHSLLLEPGDTLYVFSDGFADQFGGEKGKKYKSANFKKLLLSIKEENMQRQKELIDEAFEQWKGELEQLDDVCVIGVRV